MQAALNHVATAAPSADGAGSPKPDSSAALDDPSLYFNRELSWLEFNRRVLEEAQDPSVPLLERLKFLAIVESNLDEFYMVRVGGLQQKVQAGIPYGSGADRTPPAEQLERIGQVVRQMNADKHRCFIEEVLPALVREGIVIKVNGKTVVNVRDGKHQKGHFALQVNSFRRKTLVKFRKVEIKELPDE